jgi:hypothetical protein
MKMKHEGRARMCYVTVSVIIDTVPVVVSCTWLVFGNNNDISSASFEVFYSNKSIYHLISHILEMESFLNSNGENFDMESSPNDDADDDNEDEDEDEVRAWKEVHSTLLMAVNKAQEAIAIQKAQRRFWLEEIVYNLDDAGRPTNRSVWKRPVRARTDAEETKQKKKKKANTTKGLVKSTTASAATASVASQGKKKKAPKSEGVIKVKSNTDSEKSDNPIVPTNPKKRRKKNDPENEDPPTSKKKPSKRTKTQTLDTQRTGTNKKPKSSPKRSKVPKASLTSYDEDRYEEDESIDHPSHLVHRNEFHHQTSSATTSSAATTATHGNPHPSSSTKLYPTNHATHYDENDPNWTDYDPQQQQHHPYAAYNDNNHGMPNNSNADDDTETDHGDMDDDSVDPPPPSAMLLSLSSHHSTTTTTPTPTIRNYTSLQDIAMNDDDSDEEDRF